jgi:competence protein ComGC
MQSEKPSLPQIVLDYVDLIIRKMKYKRNVRQDVRAELLAHFEDALREVDNEQDRQKQAEELIRDFGDAKLLATLIRRGKKRCRSMWQKAVIQTLYVIIILLSVLCVYMICFFAGKPVINTDYLVQMNQMARPSADDSLNAWPLYKEAAVQYQKPDANDFDLMPQTIANLDDSQRHILETWLANNQKAMEIVRQGNQMPYYWQHYSIESSQQEDYPELIEVLLPHLWEYKKIAQLFCWNAYKKAQKGNIEEAMNIAIEAYDLGRHIRGYNAAIVEQLVGFSIEGQACKTILEVLSFDNANSAGLASVQQNLERVMSAENFRLSLDAEKILQYDEIQRSFTHSHIGGNHLYIRRIEELTGKELSVFEVAYSAVIKPKVAFNVLFTHPNQQETINTVQRLFAIVEKSATVTPAAQKQQQYDFKEQIDKELDRNLFLKFLFPNLDRVSAVRYQIQVQSEATVVIIAVRRFKLEKGQFPASMDELAKNGYIKKIPMDPYTDKPIVYKYDDKDFSLYSIGPDFEDDGGMPGKDSKGKYDFGARSSGDIVFWPVHKEASAQK